jgi:hypothetical protein
MTRSATSAFAALIVGLTFTPSLPALQLQTPTDWKWRADTAVSVTNIDKDMPADHWFYVAMPPGWHMTTRTGVLTWHPAHTGRGVFRIESQAFLFPGTSAAEYGVFIGGRQIEGTAPASYTAFVTRRDGQIAVIRQEGTEQTMVVPWKANAGAVAHDGGDGTAKNVFRVDVTAADMIFAMNGTEVARVPKAQVTTDGTFGLRAGPDLNLHVSTFDVTYPLAPTPIKR